MTAEHHGHDAAEKEHPGPKTYAKIAAILTIVTFIEVWVFYIPALATFIVPILSVLSAIKFCLVVMFYMHLKFDHPVFTRVLVMGVVVAFGAFLWVLALFVYSHPIERI